jgi:hypothetical protein
MGARPPTSAVGQQRVDVERHLGHAHAVAPRRDGGVQVGQRLAVIEPGDFRHHAIEQVEDAIRFRDEGFSRSRQSTPSVAVLVEHPRRAGAGFLGRQVHQRQVIAALEVVARFLEGGAAFFVHQPRQRLGKLRVRIVGSGRRSASMNSAQPEPSGAARCSSAPTWRSARLASRCRGQARETGPCAGN